MRIETFSQLSKTDFHIDWIVENLISPGQWTYFVGPPGSGKSMLTIQLCDALQDAKPFLGLKTKQHNCLYIQADAGRMEWRKQVHDLAGDSFAWTMHEIEKGFLDNTKWVEYIHHTVWGTYPEDDPRSAVLKHNPYTFVVFDCLNAITEKDINTKTTMNFVLRALEYICTKELGGEDEKKEYLRIHFMLIHHPSAGGGNRGVHAGSGYKGYAALCGNMLTLASNILVLEKNKITSCKELMLERDRETGAWLIQSEGLKEKGGKIRSIRRDEDDIDMARLLGTTL